MAGLRKIARELGLSVSTVSRALGGSSHVRSETRNSVLRAVERQGYVSNVYIQSVMSSIRKGHAQQFRGTMGILWTGGKLRSDPRLRDLRAGIFNRAEDSNFVIDEFFLETCPEDRLSRILDHRGIEGLLIVAPAIQGERSALKVDLRRLSCICLGSALIQPRLHRIRFDYFEGMRLALGEATRRVGGPVAAVWNDVTDELAHRTARAAFLAHHPAGLSVADQLFLTPVSLESDRIRTLFRKHRVKALIFESGIECPTWLEKLVPPSRQVIFRRPVKQECLGWIDTQNRVLGAWGVEFLAAKIHQHEQGIPERRQELLVPPVWFDGGNHC